MAAAGSGRPTPEAGLDQPGFKTLLGLARTGRAFVKLSGYEKFSREPYPYTDVHRYVRALIDAFTLDACVWASDWPFLKASKRVDYGPLLKLVEISVDGGLEATMYETQAQLADAYLERGEGIEARVIAEDLVAREPWEKANIERFRRALELMGEPDPDGLIAARLSGELALGRRTSEWFGRKILSQRIERGLQVTPAPEDIKDCVTFLLVGWC